jgi:hypothetical protein
MPLPTSRVIDPRWSGHHRPTAAATMTAECVITRPTGGGTTGPGGIWTPPAAATLYTGACRVQALATNERLLPRGDTTETHRRYLVAVAWDTADPAIGDLIAITASVDPHLTGKKLRVIDIRYGAEQWQRDLICDEMEG